MKVRKLVAISAGTLMLVTNITPILADEVCSMDTNTVMNICEDSIDGSSKLINDIIDGIEIEKEEPITVYNETSYVQQPVVYTYVEQEIPAEQTMSVDEFMTLYGSMMEEESQEVTVPVDTSAQQAAYDIALSNYNAALAEYEAANQMIETTKDVEVEITEEVMDEEGNVSEITRTEIQTVIEMILAGDVVSAQANLDVAKAALDDAQMALDSVVNSIIIEETTVTNETETMQEPEVTEDNSIDEDIVVKETVNFASSGTCGDNLTWTLDDNGLLTISGTGDMTNYKEYSSDSAPWKGVMSVVLPEGITSIGDRAFSSCQISNINIPVGVKYIGDYAFAYNNQITDIIIPSGVEYIGEYTFYGCDNLFSVNIPDSVTYIGYKAFDQTPFIENYTNDFVVLGNGVLYAYNGSETTIIIPKNVKHIGGAFYRQRGASSDSDGGITSITIPEGVKSIGSFFGFYHLSSISISDSVTDLGSFYNCNSLTSFTIPRGVTTIEKHLFNYCTALKSIFIPETVTKIEEEFYYLSDIQVGSLLDVYFEGSEEQWNQVIGHEYVPTSIKQDYAGTLPYKNVTIHFGIPSGKLSESIIWTMDRNGLLTLSGTGDWDFTNALWDTGRVKQVYIGQGITGIGKNTFKGCCNLESVSIPKTVTNIKDGAFYGCSRLESIAIPSGIKSIGNSAFFQCESINSITIPNSIENIGDGAFSRCYGLVDVYYQGTEEDWNNKDLYSFEDVVTIHFAKQLIPFEDVPKDAWYYSVAKECYETGLINGTSATTFSPLQTMTRAMVVTILWRMDGQPKTEFSGKFKDVSSGQWYATSISWAANNGVVNGYGDGTFKPDAAVTREQVAVMLANYAGYKKVYKPGTKKLNTYPDGSQVSLWAQQGMKWALTNGIISGDGAGYLRPKKSATRAEGAAMLLRMNNWL